MPQISNELQIQIDDAFGCPGRCPGCSLSASERKQRASAMPDTLIRSIFQALTPHARALPGLAKINVTYGIADHLTMGASWLSFIAEEAELFLSRMGMSAPSSAVFISASLVGRPNLIAEKLQRLASCAGAHGFPIVPVVILDPLMLDHPTFRPSYEENLKTCRALFERVDLSLNLSDAAIRAMSPEALYAFAKAAGHDEVTVNWTPTADNLSLAAGDMPALTQWLKRFASLVRAGKNLSCSYAPVIEKTMNLARQLAPGSGAMGALQNALDETILRSLQFDHEGHVFAKFEAIGDIAQSPRFGFEPLGRLQDWEQEGLSLRQGIERALPGSKRQIMKSLSNPVCIACPKATLCALSGFHAYNRPMESIPSRGACKHSAFALFGHYERMDEEEAAEKGNLPDHSSPLAITT